MKRRAVIAGGLAAALGTFTALRAKRTPARAPELVRHPEGLLDVLPGFEVVVLGRTGDAMTDGYRTPGMPDGMGVFELGAGQFVLMRNHELWPAQSEISAFAGERPQGLFDPASNGAVTRLELDPKSLRVLRSNLALAGTNVNCAGGKSPLGWLSCEENVDPGHGYVFACDPRATSLAPPRQLPAFGRFRHEGAVTDPQTGISYLTEDRPDGCLYRVVPSDPQKPEEGRLEALALEGFPDTSAMTSGQRGRVAWVPLTDPCPEDDGLRRRAREAGASVFRRGEGIHLEPHEDGGARVLFTATGGGPAGLGQLFELSGEEATCVLASSDPSALQMPDNVFVTRTGHVLIAEDGTPPNAVRVLCPSGRLVTLAQNPGDGEIAGVCALPDSSVVFLNLQQRGITLALRGPLADLA